MGKKRNTSKTSHPSQANQPQRVGRAVIIDAGDRTALTEFFTKGGQVLLPLLDLVERSERAVDEVIDVVGRATIEALLRLSAEQVAGPKVQGTRRAIDQCQNLVGDRKAWVHFECTLAVVKPLVWSTGVIIDVGGASQDNQRERLNRHSTADDFYCLISPIWVSVLRISSVMPTLKYSFSGSALRLRKGRTAIDAAGHEESTSTGRAGVR